MFQSFQPKAKDSNKGHFNFPKFHTMTHFMDHIHQFGTTNSYNTSNGKAAYKYTVKAYWNQTNKQSNFELQIYLYNTQYIFILTTKS